MLGEIIRCRTDGVSVVGPNVPSAALVEIKGVGEIARRHELRLSHRARPRADHLPRSNATLFEDDQGGKQLVTEVVAAKADISEARQRLNHIVRSEIVAEIGLEAPDAQNHGLVDAVGVPGFG